MQTATALQTQHQPSGYLQKLAICLSTTKNKTLSHWTVEQLRLEPYQHILEVGFGLGNTLREAATNYRLDLLQA